MAAPVKKKARKKAWYALVAPEMFKSKEIGHTPASDPRLLEGRVISVNMSELTGDFRHFQTAVMLRVARVSGGKALTVYHGQKLSDDRVARIVSRWSSRIDAVTDCTSKDGVRMRVKTLLVTSRRVSTSVKNSLRASLAEETRKFFQARTIKQAVSEVSMNKPQKAINKKLSRIYPVRTVEVRKIEVLSRLRAAAPPPEEPAEEKKEERPVEEKAEKKESKEDKPVKKEKPKAVKKLAKKEEAKKPAPKKPVAKKAPVKKKAAAKKVPAKKPAAKKAPAKKPAAKKMTKKK